MHQLIHNMTRDCSLNSRKIQVHNIWCTKIVFLFLFWHSKQYLYRTCCELLSFREFNEQSLVILWINWFKNESFWHRFTCMKQSSWISCIFSSIQFRFINDAKMINIMNLFSNLYKVIVYQSHCVLSLLKVSKSQNKNMLS